MFSKKQLIYMEVVYRNIEEKHNTKVTLFTPCIPKAVIWYILISNIVFPSETIKTNLHISPWFLFISLSISFALWGNFSYQFFSPLPPPLFVPCKLLIGLLVPLPCKINWIVFWRMAIYFIEFCWREEFHL